MKDFKDLKDDIFDEINDAEKYIRKAIASKEENPERAELYCRLSGEELGHMEALHGELVKEIKAWQEKTGQTPPPDMQARYDMLHEIAMDNVRKIKAEIRMFKEEE